MPLYKRRHTSTKGVQRTHRKRRKTTLAKAHTAVSDVAAQQHTVVVNEAVNEDSQTSIMIKQAQFAAQQARVCSQFAGLLSCREDLSLLKRAEKIVKMMQEDEELEHPMLTLDYQLDSGGLLLSSFFRFLDRCTDEDEADAETAWSLVNEVMHLIDKLIVSSPSVQLCSHPEERAVLALMASLNIPARFNTSPNHEYIIDWARLLIKRGADIHARCSRGYMPVQSWCQDTNLTSARGVIFLLEADADLNASHPQGQTALHLICHHELVQVLCELSEAGWLASVNLDMPNKAEEDGGITPIQLLRRKLEQKPTVAVTTMLELLTAHKRLWHTHVRPTIRAQLVTYEQLIPDIADLILSYINNDRTTLAS